MIVLRPEKQPWDRKDYDIDYSQWLSTGDTVSSASATYVCVEDADDVELDLDGSVTVTGTTTKVWAENGTTGRSYMITVRAITTGGRKIEAEIKLKIKEIGA
jgi:hypothetical protein